MSSHSVQVEWQRPAGSGFTNHRYSRAHTLRFDGGAVVPGSSSPQVVRLPFSDAAAVDPEEAFVAALSACHMLWFLDFAARAGFTVDRYRDDAEGRMDRNERGQQWVAQVLLQPQVDFSGEKAPDDAAVQQLHHDAHEACFIANSVRSDLRIEGAWRHTPQPG